MKPTPKYIGRTLDDPKLDEILMFSGFNFFVYILECADRSFYTGVTNNLDSRLWEHQNGIIESCYTFNKRPVSLVYFELYDLIKIAIAREKQLKGWSRGKKEALIAQDWDTLRRLSKKKK